MVKNKKKVTIYFKKSSPNSQRMIIDTFLVEGAIYDKPSSKKVKGEKLLEERLRSDGKGPPLLSY